jgi:hypothetical protein
LWDTLGSTFTFYSGAGFALLTLAGLAWSSGRRPRAA